MLASAQKAFMVAIAMPRVIILKALTPVAANQGFMETAKTPAMVSQQYFKCGIVHFRVPKKWGARILFSTANTRRQFGEFDHLCKYF